MDNITVRMGFQNNTGFAIDSNIYIVNAVFHFTTSIAGIFGNLLVIISVIKFRYLRETAHALVVLLACFDLAFGVTGLVEQCALLLNVYKGEMEGMSTFCLLLAVILSSLGTGNLLCVMFIAVDRFIYITYPLRYPSIVTKNKMLCVIVFTTLYFPVTSVISALMTESVKGPIVCNLSQIISRFTGYPLVVEGAVASLVFTIFYGQIAHLACKKARQIQQENTQNNIPGENNTLQQKLKGSRVLSLIIGVYISTNMCLVASFAVFNDTESTTAIIIHIAAGLIWKVRKLNCTRSSEV